MLRAVLFVCLSVLVASACAPGPAASDDATRGGGTLRVGMQADVVTLDPALATDVYSAYVSQQIHETLFAVDFDGRIVPLLAEKLVQPSPEVYLITLRRGIKFHNGEDLCAEDVKFSLGRVLDPATKSPRAGRLRESIDSPDAIEVDGCHSLKISLKQPFAPFLERLTSHWASILSRKAAEAAGADYAKSPVGTGPFRFVEWRTGEQATVERNRDYWGSSPSLERVVFRPIPEANARLAELESGGVEVVLQLPPEEIERLRRDNKVQVFVEPAAQVTYLGLNTSRPPLDDVRLRQAISSSIDRPQITQSLFAGVGIPAVSPLVPTSWGFSPRADQYPYDPARGRQVLAGNPPSASIELAIAQQTETIRLAERIQAQLRQNLGLTVNLKVMEFGALLEYLKPGTIHQMYLLGWSGDVDPDSFLTPLFHSRSFGAAGNRAFYGNPAVDGLLDEAQRTIDQEARKRLYAEAQELIMRDAPIVPIRHAANSAGLARQVAGYRLHPLNRQEFISVKLAS